MGKNSNDGFAILAIVGFVAIVCIMFYTKPAKMIGNLVLGGIIYVVYISNSKKRK